MQLGVPLAKQTPLLQVGTFSAFPRMRLMPSQNRVTLLSRAKQPHESPLVGSEPASRVVRNSVAPGG